MSKDIRLGAPTLRVRHLREARSFYEGAFGLGGIRRYSDEAEGLEVHELGLSGASEPLLILKHDPNARSLRSDFAGLYHYAVLVASRKSLASTYLAIGRSGIPYDGFADHTVSESLYLRDTEDNGIEIYADRPRETWSRFMIPPSGSREDDVRRFAALNKPLDFASMLKELSKEERSGAAPFPDGARIGHVHLRVTNLERSVKFYHESLGFDIVANYAEVGVAFLSVGGYHHHIGLNTWNSSDGAPHEPGDAGLDRFRILVPDEVVIDQLHRRLGNSRRERGDVLWVADPDAIEVEFRLMK